MSISSRCYGFSWLRWPRGRSRGQLRGQTLKRGLTPITTPILAVLLWGLTPLGLAASMGLPDGVKEALRQAGIPTQSVAIVVQEVAAPTPKINWNGKDSLNPASLMKIVTAYTALIALGPTATWRTEIRGLEPVDGIVTGDVVVVGGGDPRLTLEDWQSLLRALRIRGVKEIHGNLLLDQSRFQVTPPAADEFDHQGYRAYNAPPAALLVGFRAITLTLTVVGNRVMALPNFDLPNVHIENHLLLKISKNSLCPADWKSAVTQQVADSGQEATITLSGELEAGCDQKTLAYSVLTNTHFIESAFHKIWEELGGVIRGTVREGVAASNTPLLVSHESPPLLTQIQEMNKFSNNVMARMLYLNLGWQENSGPATLETSKQRVQSTLDQEGLHFPELVLENGAGLSRKERISAENINKVLIKASKSPYWAEFMASLPIAGLDGTAKSHLGTDNDLEGRFHLKTGSLEGVRGVAGYGLTHDGKWVSVVFLVNHPQATNAGPAQNALLRWIKEAL
jgi:D-alanyl-D-alanine carboxypeptidase/D-alanyl-D-alanine-endopeptidase (penicillin-binding protein 4)